MCRGIDVAHLIFPHTGIGQRQFHTPHGALTFFGRSGDVIGIAVHAVTHHLGIDADAPQASMVQLFQHDDAGAFTEDESVTVFIKRTTGFCRLVISERERF